MLCRKSADFAESQPIVASTIGCLSTAPNHKDEANFKVDSCSSHSVDPPEEPLDGLHEALVIRLEDFVPGVVKDLELEVG